MRNVSLLISLMVVLGACGHNLVPDRDEINVYPTNYKSDILAAMHTYLNNPTGIRDAAISEPTLKSTGVVEQPDNLPLLAPHTVNRYVACLRFTPKKTPANMAGQGRSPPCSWAGGWTDLSIYQKQSVPV